MEQVRELLRLIDCRRVDGVIMAMNFTFYWIQPSKERAHPRFKFRGDIDGTQEVPKEIDRDKAKCRVSMLFNLAGRLSVKDQQWAFSVRNLPPTVRVLCDVHLIFLVAHCIHSCC
jgi:hypothetical protein